MGKTGRVVIGGIPHHIIQRGNRRQQIFFSASDYDAYIQVMRERCDRHSIEVWAYCLMPNHVHLIAVPHKPDELGRAVGEAHRYHAVRVNMKKNWIGHLWRQRFASYPMDEEHLLTAARYIEMNPVVARLTTRPEGWRWSSARAHLSACDDKLVAVGPLLKLVPDWRGFLEQGSSNTRVYEKHEGTGLPLGDISFVEHCEQLTGRILRPQKRGPQGPRRRKP
ncbi:MAG: transposase [Candidatus Eisenbacteria bacterium]